MSKEKIFIKIHGKAKQSGAIQLYESFAQNRADESGNVQFFAKSCNPFKVCNFLQFFAIFCNQRQTQTAQTRAVYNPNPIYHNHSRPVYFAIRRDKRGETDKTTQEATKWT